MTIPMIESNKLREALARVISVHLCDIAARGRHRAKTFTEDAQDIAGDILASISPCGRVEAEAAWDRALVEKMPPLDMEWPAEWREKWIDWACDLMARARAREALAASPPLMGNQGLSSVACGHSPVSLPVCLDGAATPSEAGDDMRTATARIIWNRFGPPHDLEFPGAIHEWGSVADQILVLVGYEVEQWKANSRENKMIAEDAERERRDLLNVLKNCRTHIAGFTAGDGAADRLFNELQRIHAVACAAIAKAEDR